MKRLWTLLGVLSVLCIAALVAGPSHATGSPGSGSIERMNKKEAVTGIEWEVNPGQVIIFLDGKKIGDAEKLRSTITKTKPGKHAVRLVNGMDETEMDVQVRKGQTLKFTFTFDSE